MKLKDDRSNISLNTKFITSVINCNNSEGKYTTIVLIGVMKRISVLEHVDDVSLYHTVQANTWCHFMNGCYYLTTDVIVLTFA